MIDFRNVSLSFGDQTLLDDVSFRIEAGDRTGIVGPNGAGKSTVFALLTGEMTPDGGEIGCMRGVRMGHLHQQLDLGGIQTSILDYAEDARPEIRAMQHEIAALEAAMSASVEPERGRMLRRLGELQTNFEHQEGYHLRSQAEAALCGLGFATTALGRPLCEFSGGWQMRVELARAIVAHPDLLLLDEPTNFLDIPAVEWLQRILREFRGTLLLVSHDRYLLNTLTTSTLEVTCGRVTRYAGNYQWYTNERIKRHEQMQSSKANQDRYRAQTERFINRFRATSAKAAQVQSRIKRLAKMDEILVPEISSRSARLRVATPPPCGVEIMRIEGAGVSYDDQNWVLRGLDLRISRGDKIGIVGLNGTGKTTLLRTLAGIMPLREGRRVVGHNVLVGYQAQDFSETMDPAMTVLATAKAAAPNRPERDIRGVLGGFLFSGDAVDKPVAVLSGGEKMRLAFVRLLLNPPNFLLLDEPTTHLDIGARETLEQAMQSFEGTICVVSHDIEFVRHVATSILAMTPPTVRPYAGTYDYYREKMARETAALGTPGETAVLSDFETAASGDRKAQRRERARLREERSHRRRPLQQRVRAAEMEVARLEKEQAALVTTLNEATPGTDYSKLNRRLTEIQYELRIATEAWEAAGRELETLDREDAAPAES